MLILTYVAYYQYASDVDKDAIEMTWNCYFGLWYKLVISFHISIPMQLPSQSLFECWLCQDCGTRLAYQLEMMMEFFPFHAN
jgi:hypothetical protein